MRRRKPFKVLTANQREELRQLQAGIDSISTSFSRASYVGQKKPSKPYYEIQAEKTSSKINDRFEALRGKITHPGDSVMKVEISTRSELDPATEALLQEREATAQAIAKEKSARVAPAYNKGNPVYITDDMLKDMKSGLLRRRQ